MCDYEGCADKIQGLIKVIRLKDGKELMFCGYCAYLHRLSGLVILEGK